LKGSQQEQQQGGGASSSSGDNTGTWVCVIQGLAIVLATTLFRAASWGRG
jgi:hypothetical protein